MRILSSILGGLCGVAVLVGLAASIGWVLARVGWSPQ